MEKEKDMENIFGIKINIMKDFGKKENKKGKDIFIIKEKEIIIYGKKGKF